jgi:hypothetical protein
MYHNSESRIFTMRSSGAYWEIIHVESSKVFKKIPKIGEDQGYRAATNTVKKLNKQFAD